MAFVDEYMRSHRGDLSVVDYLFFFREVNTGKEPTTALFVVPQATVRAER